MSYYEEDSIAQINIIPFVDIILVVLIIFMVTAPQLIQEGFSVKLPQTSPSSSMDTSSSQLKITVNHTGDVFLKGQLISLEDLSFHSKKLVELQPFSKVVVAADVSVSHGRVMQIVNTVKQSGVQNIMFATSQ